MSRRARSFARALALCLVAVLALLLVPGEARAAIDPSTVEPPHDAWCPNGHNVDPIVINWAASLGHTDDACLIESGELMCPTCGATWTIENLVTEHDWRETGRDEAACTGDGAIHYTCARCDDTKDEAVPATGHSWEEHRVEATCTQGGSVSRSCAICGEEEVLETLPATGHSWEETSRTTATATRDGKVVRTCSGCGETETETIPATGGTGSTKPSSPSGTSSPSKSGSPAVSGDTSAPAAPSAPDSPKASSSPAGPTSSADRPSTAAGEPSTSGPSDGTAAASQGMAAGHASQEMPAPEDAEQAAPGSSGLDDPASSDAATPAAGAVMPLASAAGVPGAGDHDVAHWSLGQVNIIDKVALGLDLTLLVAFAIVAIPVLHGIGWIERHRRMALQSAGRQARYVPVDDGGDEQ